MIWPCIYTSFPVRYGQGRTRKRTPGSGTKGKTKGSGKGKGNDAAAWSMAMSAVSDLASVARSVLEGQKSVKENMVQLGKILATHTHFNSQ